MSRIKRITPIGEAYFPAIQKPDTQFDSQGIYQIKVFYDKAEIQEEIKAINAVIAKEVAEQHKITPNKTEAFKRAPLPYKDMDDGRIQITFKSKFKPLVLDKKMNAIPEGTEVWSGSKVRVEYELQGYNNVVGLGCKLYLKGVQVSELVEGSATGTGLTPLEDKPGVAVWVKKKINLENIKSKF